MLFENKISHIEQVGNYLYVEEVPSIGYFTKTNSSLEDYIKIVIKLGE